MEPAAIRQDRGTDRREDGRLSLLIRSAKLVCDTGELLCVVRDVSSNGVKLRLFHPLPPDNTLMLELSSGQRYPLERIWEGQRDAGFRFARTIDVDRFIAETSPHPKRPLRLRFEFPAIIQANGEEYEAQVQDLSCQGARIETDQTLAIGQRLTIRAEGLPEKVATVCWRRRPSHGLAFRQGLTFEGLALLAYRMQAKLPAGAIAEPAQIDVNFAAQISPGMVTPA